MSEQHNTDTSSVPELPSIGIVISGSDVLARKKTIESIEQFEKLKNLELQKRETNIVDIKIKKKFKKKSYKKKTFYKKAK